MSRIKICRDLRTFWKSFGKKNVPFWVKNSAVLLGQEVHYYMVYIAYFTELNLQICDYAQKRRICRENCKYVLDENFHGHFCPRRKAAKFCHPAWTQSPGTCSASSCSGATPSSEHPLGLCAGVRHTQVLPCQPCQRRVLLILGSPRVQRVLFSFQGFIWVPIAVIKYFICKC